MEQRLAVRRLKPLANLVSGRPLLAIFEVSLTCNSACGYCNLPLNIGRYEMSRAEIYRVFSALHAYGLRFVFVQGGEPTLRRDLPGILQDLGSLGFHVTLITNGTRLKPEIIEACRQHGVSISVSLDTLDAERYRRIRGADQLHLVVEGLQRLRDYPHPKFLTCIVTELNQADVPAVLRFARRHGFMPVVGAYHWNIERYGKVDPNLIYQRQSTIGVFQQALASGLVPRGYLRRYLRDTITWLEGRALDPCDAGRYSVAIDASGNVAPCLALKQAGNLLTESLESILARFDRSEIQACSSRSTCNMLCSRVVGAALRHPLEALLTPRSLRPMQGEA